MKNKYIVLTLFVIWIIVCLILFNLYKKEVKQEQIKPVITPIELIEVNNKTVRDIIITLSIDSNVSTKTALRIAECESQYGKYKENLEGSSAKGIYQFTDSTWKNYCYGDVMNDYDNINCFLKLYPDHKDWWVCS